MWPAPRRQPDASRFGAPQITTAAGSFDRAAVAVSIGGGLLWLVCVGRAVGLAVGAVAAVGAGAAVAVAAVAAGAA